MCWAEVRLPVSPARGTRQPSGCNSPRFCGSGSVGTRPRMGLKGGSLQDLDLNPNGRRDNRIGRTEGFFVLIQAQCTTLAYDTKLANGSP
jgi:hypothetical protein